MKSVIALLFSSTLLFVGVANGGRLRAMLSLTSDEFEAGMIWPTGKVR